MKYWLQAMAGLLLMGSAVARAEETIFAPPGDHWMEWAREYQEGASRASYLKWCRFDAAAVDKFDVALQRLANLWAQTPGMTGPNTYGQMRGFFGVCSGMNRGDLSWWPWDGADVELRPVPGHPGEMRPTLKPGSETAPLRIEVNHLAGLIPISDMNGSNANGPFGVLSTVTRHIQGYPVYDDMYMVITVPGRESLFKPAKLGDALGAWIKDGPRDGKFGRKEARQRYDSLDEAKRGGAAWLCDTDTSRIEASGGTGCKQIYRYNGDYYDNKLPPNTIQIMRVNVHFIDIDTTRDNRNVRYKRQRAVFEDTDWHRMASELLN